MYDKRIGLVRHVVVAEKIGATHARLMRHTALSTRSSGTLLAFDCREYLLATALTSLAAHMAHLKDNNRDRSDRIAPLVPGCIHALRS